MKIKFKAFYLVLLILTACSSPDQEEAFVRPVRSMLVETGSQISSRNFSGTAQTDRVIDLSFRSGGVITTFNIRLGQKVEQGEVLAELDNVAARLAYEQARSSLNSAKSNLDTQQLNQARVRDLYEQGGASLSDYEMAKNSFRTANASFRSAQRSVDIQQEQIRYGKIIAPESGVIAAVNNDINENVSAGQTVAVLNAGTEMEIQLGLPESVINLVELETDVSVSFSALAGQKFVGKVKEISPSIDQQTATYPVRIGIVNPTLSLRAGMAATVTFSFDEESESREPNGGISLLVPANAVGEDGNGRFVYSLMPDQNEQFLVTKRKITIGKLYGDSFEVLEGLEAGDRIVTAGVHSVIDGQQVKLTE